MRWDGGWVGVGSVVSGLRAGREWINEISAMSVEMPLRLSRGVYCGGGGSYGCGGDVSAGGGGGDNAGTEVKGGGGIAV